MPASDRRLQKQVNGINLAMFGKLSKQTTNETETETELRNWNWIRNGREEEDAPEQLDSWELEKRAYLLDDGINVSRTVIRGCQPVSLDG